MTVAILFRFLLQEQRRTSTAVIQAYLDELERAQVDLDHAIRDDKQSLIERALDEITETLERIRESPGWLHRTAKYCAAVLFFNIIQCVF